MKISIRSLTCLLFVLAYVLVTVKSQDPPAGPPQPVNGTDTEQPGTTFPNELETVSYYVHFYCIFQE